MLLQFLAVILSSTSARPIFTPHDGDSWDWLLITEGHGNYCPSPSNTCIFTDVADTSILHWSIHASPSFESNQWRIQASTTILGSCTTITRIEALSNTPGISTPVWTSGSQCFDTAVIQKDSKLDTLAWHQQFSHPCPSQYTILMQTLNIREGEFTMDSATCRASDTSRCHAKFERIGEKWKLSYTLNQDTGWFIEDTGLDSAVYTFSGPSYGKSTRTISLLQHNGIPYRNPIWMTPGSLRRYSFSREPRKILVGYEAWILWKQAQPHNTQLTIQSISGHKFNSGSILPAGQYLIENGREHFKLVIP